MKSRKPMLVVAGVLVSVLVLLVLGGTHWLASRKDSGITVHSQSGPSGKLLRREAKATTLIKHQDSSISNPSATCPVVSAASNASGSGRENASASPRPSGPRGVQVVVIVSSDPTPDAGFRFFRQQAEHQPQQSGSDWHHFRLQTQNGQ